MEDVYCLIAGFIAGAVVCYLYAKKVISKAVEFERQSVDWAESTFHKVLDRIKAAL